MQALLVRRDGETLFERYAPGFDSGTPHALFSGSKSFWGPLALVARDDGLLDLDETVGATFALWNAGARARVRLRDLLQLTSGIPFGGLGSAVPSYEKALAVELKDEPGTRFTYGGIPLQVFGAVLARKLGERTPHAYLRERILEPAGIELAWRTLADGRQPLPTGASLSAAAWAAWGMHVQQQTNWSECFTGSQANPRYGLGWWLSPLPSAPDVAYASGAGGQALYLLPSERTVVAKFGKSGTFAHATFLRRLFS